ncbi:hypothetical protein SRHO_G00281170 [Serrasalmus rhombeus]
MASLFYIKIQFRCHGVQVAVRGRDLLRLSEGSERVLTGLQAESLHVTRFLSFLQAGDLGTLYRQPIAAHLRICLPSFHRILSQSPRRDEALFPACTGWKTDPLHI